MLSSVSANRRASRWRNEKCLLQCWGGRTTEGNEPLLSNITEPNSGCFLTCCSNPVLDIWRAMEENPSSLFPVGPAKLIPWEIISFLDSRGQKLQLWDRRSLFSNSQDSNRHKTAVRCVESAQVQGHTWAWCHLRSKMTDIYKTL